MRDGYLGWGPSLAFFASCTLSVASSAAGVGSELTRELLPSAVCADGSPAWFHLATNASSSDYVFYLQGGAVSCAHNETLCEEGGESTSLPFSEHEVIPAAGMLSGDPPHLYSTFNRVLIPYCTMDMFLLDTQSFDGELQFRGRRLLEETLTVVLSTAPESANVVLAGSTAGGVGAFNAARWVLDTFDQVAELSVIIDSAFRFDVTGFAAPFLEYLQRYPSAAYSSYCSEEFNGGPCCLQFACMVEKGYYPGQSAFFGPDLDAGRMRGTFAISSAQHPLEAQQMIGELGAVEGKLPTLAWDARAQHVSLTDPSLGNLASLYPSTLSVFSPGCAEDSLLVVGESDLSTCLPEAPPSTYKPGYASGGGSTCSCLYDARGLPTSRTCEGAWDVDSIGLHWEISQSFDQFETIQVDGTSVRVAMEQWWSGRGDASQQVLIVDGCDGLGCNPSCPSDLLVPASRGESDGVIVWAVVLATFACIALVLGGGCLAAVWSCLRWKQVKQIVAKKRSSPQSWGESQTNINCKGRPGASSSGSSSRSSNSNSPILQWEGVSHWLTLPRNSRLREYVDVEGDDDGDDDVTGEKQLLFSAAGSVPDGALCALMGPSDSGKSTLLGVLSGRRSVGRLEGTVFFEGRPVTDNQASYIRQSGYIRQGHRGFVEGLTVFDNLVFAAMLRTPGSLEIQTARVETVIQETALEASRDLKARDLTAGQKRRLSVAVELLSDRRVLLLDQPFVDLGAAEAHELMNVLKCLYLPESESAAVLGTRRQAGKKGPGREVGADPRSEALSASEIASSDMASTVMMNIMSASGTSSMRSGTTSMTSGTSLLHPRGFDGSEEEGDVEAPSSRFSNNYGRSSGGGGYSYPDSTASSCTSGVGFAPDDIDREGSAGGAGEGGKKHLALPRGTPSRGTRTPSRGTPSVGSRSHRKGRSRAESTTSTVSGGGVIPPRIAECSASSPTTEAATDTATTTPNRLDRGESDDALSTSFSEFSSGDSRRGPTTPRRPGAGAGAAGDGFKGEASGVAGGGGGGGGLGRGAHGDARGDGVGVGVSGPDVDGGGDRGDPDTILEMLAMIGTEGLDLIAREARGSPLRRGLARTASLPPKNINIKIERRRQAAGGEGRAEEMEEEEGKGRVMAARASETAAWKVAAILLARTYKGGYAMYLLRQFLLLMGTVLLAAASFRAVASACGSGVEVSNLAFSVLFAIVLPVLIIYRPLVIPATRREWRTLARVEVADGLYSPACATARLVFDQFAVAAVVSFAVVGIMAWLSFSGVFLLTSVLPWVLRAVAYTSPHYWTSTFMLRVLLDGLDLADGCDSTSVLACATSYGDLVATRLGLRVRSTGFSAVVMASFALASLLLLVATAVRQISSRRFGEGAAGPGTGLAQEASAAGAASKKSPCSGRRMAAGDGLSPAGCAVNGTKDSAVDSVFIDHVVGGDGGKRPQDRPADGTAARNTASCGKGSSAANSAAGRATASPPDARVKSGGFGSRRGKAADKALAYLAEQQEEKRCASLRTTADIIQLERQQRLAAAAAATETSAPLGPVHGRTASGTLLFNREIKWPTFLTPGRSRRRRRRSRRKAVSDQFPASSKCGSSPGFSFKSFSPPFSDTTPFPDDGGSPPPPQTPGKPYVKITADALARGTETSRSPLKFARGLGGWWAETSAGEFQGRSSYAPGVGGGGDTGGPEADSQREAGGGKDRDGRRAIFQPLVKLSPPSTPRRVEGKEAATSAAADSLPPSLPQPGRSSGAIGAAAPRPPVMTRPMLMDTQRSLSGPVTTAALAAGAAAAQAEPQVAEPAAAAATAEASTRPLLEVQPKPEATSTAAGPLPEEARMILSPAVVLAGMGARERVFARSNSRSSPTAAPKPALSASPRPGRGSRPASSPPVAESLDTAVPGGNVAGDGAKDTADAVFSRHGGTRATGRRPQQPRQDEPTDAAGNARTRTSTAEAGGPPEQHAAAQPPPSPADHEEVQRRERRPQLERKPPPAPARPPGRPAPRAPQRVPSGEGERGPNMEEETTAGEEHKRCEEQQREEQQQEQEQEQEEQRPTEDQQESDGAPQSQSQAAHRSFEILFPGSAAEDEEEKDDNRGGKEIPRFHRGFEVMFPSAEPLSTVLEQQEEEMDWQLTARAGGTPPRRPSYSSSSSARSSRSARSASASGSGSVSRTTRSFFPGAPPNAKSKPKPKPKQKQTLGSGGGYTWGSRAPSSLSPTPLLEEDEYEMSAGGGEYGSGGSSASGSGESGSSSSSLSGGSNHPGALDVAARRAKMTSKAGGGAVPDVEAPYSPGYGME
eukprot:g15897.t1